MGRTISTLAVVILAIVLGGPLAGCKSNKGTSFEELRYTIPTKTVQVGTAKITYAEFGQGEKTLVLIHGLGSYLPAWSRNFEDLAREYRVIAIDLPGYGKSSKGNYQYSMRFFAKAVRGVVRALDIDKPVLVGHSMGGQIAVTYALLYPGQVESLVLTAPAGLETFEDAEAKWLAGAVTPAFTCKATPEAIYVRHAQNFHKMPREAEFMVDDRVRVIGGDDFEAYCRAVSRSVAAMLDEPVHDRLGEVDVPVLVIFGKNDQLIPNPFLHGGSTERLAKKAVTRFPEAQLVILPKAGHFAQFEQPDAWADAVLKFLRREHGPVTPVPRARGTANRFESLYEPGTDPDEVEPVESPTKPAARSRNQTPSKPGTPTPDQPAEPVVAPADPAPESVPEQLPPDVIEIEDPA